MEAEQTTRPACDHRGKGPPKWCSSRFGLAYIILLGNAILFCQRISFSMVIVCMVNHTAVDLLSRNTLQENDSYNLTLTTNSFNSSSDFSHVLYVSKVDTGGHRVLDNSTAIVSTAVFSKQAEFGNGTNEMGSTVANTDVGENKKSCNQQYQPGETPLKDREDGPFVWDKEMQGILLGAVYWGYMLFQIIGGYLFYYGGPRLVCGVSMVFMSVFTMLCHPAAYWSLWAVFALRVGIGIGTSFTIPSMFAMWGKWAPVGERATLISLSFSGQNIGNSIVFPTSALLCKFGFAGGWPSVFYVFGLLGLVWCAAWFILVSDEPETHGRIHPVEQEYIMEHRSAASYMKGEKLSVPWLKILTSMCFWAIVGPHMAFTWGLFLFLSNLPLYMREVMNFDIKSNGLFSMLPYIALGMVQFCGGLISDTVVRRKILNAFWARRFFSAVSSIIPAILLVIISYLDCNQVPAVMTMLVIAIGCSGFAFSSFLINSFDIAPRYAISINSISNSFACIPGILTPYVVAEVTKDKTRERWQVVFFITAGIYVFGTVFFFIFAKTSIQSWAIPSKSRVIEYELVNGSVKSKAAKTEEDKNEEEKENDVEKEALFDENAASA